MFCLFSGGKNVWKWMLWIMPRCCHSKVCGLRLTVGTQTLKRKVKSYLRKWRCGEPSYFLVLQHAQQQQVHWFIICILFYSIFPGSGCTDGILIVGGKTATGPSKDISLLSSDWRWCSSSGFPELPYPLVSPAAYLHGGSLLVCGFPGKRSCKYTQQGWAGSWRIF